MCAITLVPVTKMGGYNVDTTHNTYGGLDSTHILARYPLDLADRAIPGVGTGGRAMEPSSAIDVDEFGGVVGIQNQRI